MKTISRFYVALFVVIMLMSAVPLSAQEEVKPEIYVVTTMHWNLDKEDGSNEEWMALEKEYLEKVTMKNEHILGSSYYTHMLTTDSRELMQVEVYGSWDAIDKAGDRNAELVQEGWPDQESRREYFQKRNSYTTTFHSDEMYNVMDQVKPFDGNAEGGMLLYMRKSKFAFPSDGSGQEFRELYNGTVDNIVKKNEYVKGYYPSNHYYGTDRNDFIEAYFIKSLDELDKMFTKNGELAREAWPDDDARAERQKKFQRYFTGVHSDAVYFYISELTKATAPPSSN